jgi:ACS family glucarate transporter-like MFS transporter/ACS family D-galactonate transporter-like MFS transporter
VTTQPTRYRYRVLAWLTTAAAAAYLCRNAVGVAESTIRSDLLLSLDQSGWFMGVFFWTYAVLQVPSGWFIQRVGTRAALTCFALAWSLATASMGVVSGFWGLLLAQLVMGAAQAGVFPAACHTIGHWMPLTSRSAACGILAAGMQLGAILASGLTAELLGPLGWRNVFLAFSLPGILWAIGFAIRFRNLPAQVPRVNVEERHLIEGERGGAKSSEASPSEAVNSQGVESGRAGEAGCSTHVRSRSQQSTNPSMTFLVFLCGQQICRAAGYMFFASWFPTFLQETRGVSITASGYQQAFVLGGTLTGSLCGGYVTDWVYRRTSSLRMSRGGVGTIALGGCAMLIFIAYFVASANIAVGLITAGAFFAALAGPCALAATIDEGGQRVAELFGLMNMTGNLAAGACPVVVAWLVQQTNSWELTLLMFAVTYLVGSGCWLMISTLPNSSSLRTQHV